MTRSVDRWRPQEKRWDSLIQVQSPEPLQLLLGDRGEGCSLRGVWNFVAKLPKNPVVRRPLQPAPLDVHRELVFGGAQPFWASSGPEVAPAHERREASVLALKATNDLLKPLPIDSQGVGVEQGQQLLQRPAP